ncbi:MAG: ribosome assembly cofactor RimP [Bacteroidales bacterium]|nr:ribosome assembly cofactor RimP [Bacteroidales bacterium]
MIDKNIIIDLVEEKLSGSESFLVDVQIKPGNCIVVEIDNIEGIDIDECVGISKFIESKLDRDIEDYELEVGSAGITSPLKVLKQYLKNVGSEVDVLTKAGVKYRGILKSADSESFIISTIRKIKQEGSKKRVEVEEQTTFTYDEVKYVKCVIDFK